ncbi:MBL fold metallo-hydrolase [Aquipuribacter sp. SD81]|uniref:MBL fold metallo-hydrolase n=1 Tax=Aquipuribacter sp. SD81 TaxID=3127703 RepID=UPI003018F830
MLRVGDDGVPALHTDRDGPAVHLDLGPVVVSKASVSEQDNACYVLTPRSGGGQVLVDAADDVGTVVALAEESALVAGVGADVRVVVTTHGHWDHHRALPDAVAALGPDRVRVGREDAGDLPTGVPAPVGALDHGDVVEVPGMRLDVVHLRGHTPGSVALVLPGTDEHPPVAVTGDSLFPGGVGNTWGYRERFDSLLADVTTRLFDVLPDETLVLPGHGDGTTLGAERPELPRWRERGW